MSTPFSATEGASSACQSQPTRTVSNRSWHPSLEAEEHSWSACGAGHLGRVAATLLACSCGLAGHGAVLWFLCCRACRSPPTLYVLNLATANSAFLLSIATALVTFYSPECLCCRVGSREVTAVLNITILFTFTASIYLLVPFSATVTLSTLPPPCPHHCSRHLPVVVCALLWTLSFTLTVTLYFYPAALVVLVLGYFFSVLTLAISGLTLLARVSCCPRQHPPGKLCAVLLVAAILFPFLTADFWYWLLLRLFDFSGFAFDTSLLLACVNSTITPVALFLGSCADRFVISAKVSSQGPFEDGTEPPKGGKAPRDIPVEMAV